MLGDFVDRIYPFELAIKCIRDTARSVSYLSYIEIDRKGLLKTKLYDKGDDFKFPIAHLASICSKIPAATAYGAHIS